MSKGKFLTETAASPWRQTHLLRFDPRLLDPRVMPPAVAAKLCFSGTTAPGLIREKKPVPRHMAPFLGLLNFERNITKHPPREVPRFEKRPTVVVL